MLGHLTPLEAVELATRGLAYSVGQGAWEWLGPALRSGISGRPEDYWESDEPDMDGLARIIGGG